MTADLLAQQIGQYLEQLRSVRRLSPATLAGRGADLSAFAAWCQYRFNDPFIYWTQKHDPRSIGIGSYWIERQWWSIGQAFTGTRLRQEPLLAIYLAITLVPAIGIAALAFRQGFRVLLPAGALLLAIYWAIGLGGLGRYSASLWPAFLPLGAFCARRPTLYSLLLIASAMLQGLFLHLWIHGYGIF